MDQGSFEFRDELAIAGKGKAWADFVREQMDADAEELNELPLWEALGPVPWMLVAIAAFLVALYLFSPQSNPMPQPLVQSPTRVQTSPRLHTAPLAKAQRHPWHRR